MIFAYLYLTLNLKVMSEHGDEILRQKTRITPPPSPDLWWRNHDRRL